MLQGLTEGRIVHYVLGPTDLPESHRHCVGEVVPAIVVNCWRGLNKDDGYSNLVAFVDGSNQGFKNLDGSSKLSIWVTSRVCDESGKPGTWHWPAKA